MSSTRDYVEGVQKESLNKVAHGLEVKACSETSQDVMRNLRENLFVCFAAVVRAALVACTKTE